MNSPQRRIVFLTDYQEQLRSTVLPLCREIEKNDAATAHVLLERPTERMLALCDEAKIAYTTRGRGSPRQTPSEARKVKARRPIRTHRWLANSCFNLVKARRRVAQLQSELSQLEPAVLVLPDDRTLSTSRWVTAARRRGIPTVIVQWAAVYDADTMRRVRAVVPTETRPRLVAWLEDQVERVVPSAVYRCDGHRLWFYSSELVLAQRLVGAIPQHTPWAYGGGNSDLVAAMGPAWKQRMVEGGVPPEKIVVTGHPDQDLWWKRRETWSEEDTRSVLREIDICADARIVTIVAPALCFRQSRGNREGDMSLAQVQETLQTVVDTVLRADGSFTAVLKMHPRDTEELPSWVRTLDPARVRVVHHYPTDRLIAASTAVLCQWSSAAMIGQALERPVIIFDFHVAPSGAMWRDVQELPCAKNPTELEHLLQGLLSADGRSHLRTLSRRFVAEYLCLDGRAVERLLKEIYALAGFSAGETAQQAA